MRRRLFVGVLGLGALLAGTGRGDTAAGPSAAILVELFTSEGCSSCPPADAFLQQLIDSQPMAGVRIIGLGHHVTYWDHQGWRDRFSADAFTERQQRYGVVLHVDPVYTPQMIVDGRFQFVGSDTKAGRSAIEQAMAQPHGSIALALAPVAGDRLTVTVTASELPAVSRGDRADVMVAVIEDGLRSNVGAGENRGRLLAHAAVVRRLTAIGEAAAGRPGARADVPLGRDWQRDHLKVVAFVQERASRRVLGATVAAIR